MLVNPIAGEGAAPARAAALCAALERRGHTVERWVPETRDALARRLRGLAPGGGPDRLVVVGGDGTLGDVANALADPGVIPLAHLAVGTANMLARELALPSGPEPLADLVERGRVRQIDLGVADGRRFVMNASAGFDSLVVEEIARRRHGPLRFRGYARPILATLRRYREPRLRLVVDDGEVLEGAFAIVSNLRNYGGLFAVADGARCDSGRLDAVICARARARDLVRYAWTARRTSLARARGAVHRSARRLRLESLGEPLPVQLDGDWHGLMTPVGIEVLPAALALLVPDPS